MGTNSHTGSVQCELCPHACRIAPGGRGRCRVRANIDGRLRSVTYGRPCSVHVDPVEKKPLLHFMPGTSTLSLATVGCNLSCKHCQNWEISQGRPEEVPAHEFLPAAVPPLAQRHHCPSISYTYTEPLVFYEYTHDCCETAHGAGLRNIIVTAAYINPAPLRALVPLLDAANVDIKAMSDAFYRQICGATLEPVLAAIRILRDAGVHLEITNLVIPTLNDDDNGLQALATWVYRELGAETPLHFSRFYPQYRMTHLPPTPPTTLLRAREIARKTGLKHVYVGNIEVEDGSNTHCANCGQLLIERQHYRLLANHLDRGACSHCGHPLRGVF